MNRRPTLVRSTMILLLLLAVSHAFAQQSQFGTADEAKAMLERAVAAVKVNEAQALEMFATGATNPRGALRVSGLLAQIQRYGVLTGAQKRLRRHDRYERWIAA